MSRCIQIKSERDIAKEMKALFPTKSYPDIIKISWTTYKKLIEKGINK